MLMAMQRETSQTRGRYQLALQLLCGVAGGCPMGFEEMDDGSCISIKPNLICDHDKGGFYDLNGRYVGDSCGELVGPTCGSLVVLKNYLQFFELEML